MIITNKNVFGLQLGTVFAYYFSKKYRRKDMKKERERLQDEDILGMYLEEIRKFPLLSREDEDKIARDAKNGSEAARNKLINSNLRFVVNVAKKYQGSGLPLADLISEGNIGLITAVDRYDAGKGFHFISYAVWWIRQSILKAICDKSRLIRLPINRINELANIEKAKTVLENQGNTESDIREIAKILKIDEKQIKEIIAISKEIVSFDKICMAGQNNPCYGFSFNDLRQESPEKKLIDQSLEKDINSILDTLDSKEAEVIRSRYGLGMPKPLSLKELGAKFHLTKERIRQIEIKALKRLQHPSRKSKLEIYVA